MKKFAHVYFCRSLIMSSMLWLYTKMLFFAKNSLIYPKLQHNKDCFTKLLIVICKILSKYEIMPKIAKKYWVHPELYRKNVIFGPNLPHLPKISKQQRPFYQTLDCHSQKLIKIRNYAKNNYKILCWPWIIHQKCHFLAQICLIYPIQFA